MNIAYIGVGSNIDPENNILKALLILKQTVSVKSISNFYRTRPLFDPDQNDYYNGVWEIMVNDPPADLKFNILKGIEKKIGRVKKQNKNAPRVIDLDLLLYGDRVMKENNLVLPDPDIYKRAFIAVPLFELAPELVLPDTGKPLSFIVKHMDLAPLRRDVRFTRLLRKRLNDPQNT
ncbi:MAG: 2-amino-4-hydroxy-6-hydroxymethyldihydropteridine diphosphokinase [Spirochaetes bacterium]|nr:2-amino-4-hydroxy-6-hydroxymethyldihydropteridine diphosphokinase [Spirochaetota bacterium]